MSFGFYATYAAVWAIVIFQSLVIYALIREVAELKRLVEEGGMQLAHRLAPGTPAPAFAGTDLGSGRLLNSAELAEGAATVLLFLSPKCTVCRRLADGARRLDGADSLRTIAFCRGEEEACRAFVDQLGADIPLLYDEKRQAETSYKVLGTPTAVVLDTENKIRAYGHPKHGDDLKDLIDRAGV